MVSSRKAPPVRCSAYQYHIRSVPSSNKQQPDVHNFLLVRNNKQPLAAGAWRHSPQGTAPTTPHHEQPVVYAAAPRHAGRSTCPPPASRSSLSQACTPFPPGAASGRAVHAPTARRVWPHPPVACGHAPSKQPPLYNGGGIVIVHTALAIIRKLSQTRKTTLSYY
jgi:hypothetical protein